MHGIILLFLQSQQFAGVVFVTQGNRAADYYRKTREISYDDVSGRRGIEIFSATHGSRADRNQSYLLRHESATLSHSEEKMLGTLYSSRIAQPITQLEHFSGKRSPAFGRNAIFYTDAVLCVVSVACLGFGCVCNPCCIIMLKSRKAKESLADVVVIPRRVRNNLGSTARGPSEVEHESSSKCSTSSRFATMSAPLEASPCHDNDKLIAQVAKAKQRLNSCPGELKEKRRQALAEAASAKCTAGAKSLIHDQQYSFNSRLES